mgnify:CR=1 FL=1
MRRGTTNRPGFFMAGCLSHRPRTLNPRERVRRLNPIFTMNRFRIVLALSLLSPFTATAQTIAPDPADEPVGLDDFLVVGQPIDDYRATDALTGTKTGAALRDLPLSINVVARELIEDRRLTYLGEALDNVSGAQRKPGYGGTQNFGAFLRGFDSGFVTLRNGFRDFGFYTLRDTANVERFEVLKGPASVLYGTLQPGGITNTLTKRPLARNAARATMIVGADDFYRAEFDAGGPLNEKVSYRLNLAYENADSFRDHVENESEFIAPVISWAISERTRWSFEVEYKHTDFTWDLGLPPNPVVLELPISRFLGEPDGKNDVPSLVASSVLEHRINEHRINEHWSVRQNLSVARTEGDYNLRSAYAIAADNRTANRVAYATTEWSDNINLQHELVGRFETAGVRHQLVGGVELYRSRGAYDFIYHDLADLDIFEPVYGAQPGDSFPIFADDNTSDVVGLYAQDLVAVGESWKLLFGARYDSVRYESYDRLGQAVARESRDSAISPQAGVVYQASPALSLYTSYGTSFSPITSGRMSDGSYLDPEEGRQFEIGLKQEFFPGKLAATLATYRITKSNVSTPDPENPAFRVQVGEQKSDGVELDVAGALLPGWDVVLAAAYTDAYVSRDNRFAVGSILRGAAEWSGSVWTKYTVQQGEARGLTFGLGAYYVDERKAALPNPTWWLPSSTRLDAMLGYARERWSVQLNVKNLTDERIYDLTGTSIMPQQPRSWLVSASYAF